MPGLDVRDFRRGGPPNDLAQACRTADLPERKRFAWSAPEPDQGGAPGWISGQLVNSERCLFPPKPPRSWQIPVPSGDFFLDGQGGIAHESSFGLGVLLPALSAPLPLISGRGRIWGAPGESFSRAGPNRLSMGISFSAIFLFPLCLSTPGNPFCFSFFSLALVTWS